MKKVKVFACVVVAILFAGYASYAQKTGKNSLKNNKQTQMKTYVIEREIPNAGNLSAEELKGISQKSVSVLKEMGPGIKWEHSYVTGNKIYCVYKAKNEDLIKEHAKRGGFPANSISQVSAGISPATAN